MKRTHYTRLVTVIFLLLTTTLCVNAQRKTDVLGRGLVVVPTGSTSGSTTNFISWRRFGEEYYDVTYNLYKNGSLLASGLKTPNYTDNRSGLPSSQYQVAAVVKGVEQAKCAPITAWTQYVYKLGDVRCPTGYIDIPLAKVYDRNGNDVTAHYEPNDAEVADLDGDGELEIIIKRLNTVDAGNIYPSSNTTEFVVIDAYKINWHPIKNDDTNPAATLMWRIDCGPNMVSLNSTEINIIAYDWDEDGAAEVVLRGADNMIVYGNTGKNLLYTIGDMSVNTRDTFDPDNGAQYAWTHTGAEYLIYMNGATGALYQKTEYPLKRLEYYSTLEKEWGGRGYGHNSSKYFFGAPILDGRKASLFMARGIYGTQKMIAMELDRESHKWSQLWRWYCNNTSSPWYGQGYHNYVIADVDEDGRDEIVYGSMVIDDNGKGLNTTGLGHGDAQHVTDLDPWRKGLEFLGCLEGSTGFDYRNATTGDIYFRATSSGDDGRCIAGNFTNNYPGSIGRSWHNDIISCVTDNYLSEISGIIAQGDVNFRIYWDGDLCSEVLNSPGTAREAKIEKPGLGRLFTSDGCNMNNDSKNNPCFQGDIIGDWREEIIVRCGTNIRVYTTGLDTSYDIYTLWHDHQYRQAMVWQMMAYNQPPHLSYFLGELEGITVAPPPYTMTNRTEINNGQTISSAHNGKQVIACSSNYMDISVEDGASPWVFIDNAPYWCSGTGESNTTTQKPTINYDYYTHKVTGGAFTGAMHLAKQGQGTLVLPNVKETYTGKTDVWAGTLEFDGIMQYSPVWLNRFATLNSTGGFFNSISAEYAASIQPGGQYTKVSTITVNELNLRFGSRVVFDVMGMNEGENDQIIVGTLSTESKAGDNVWENFGPKYIKPVFQINCPYNPEDGFYPIGTVENFAEGSSINDILVEGIDASRNAHLEFKDGIIYLAIGNVSDLKDLTFNIIDGVNYDLSKDYPSSSATTYYLPKVKVNCASTNVTPTYSGTFTDEEGNVTNVGESLPKNLYTLDHEQVNESTIKDVWKTYNDNLKWADWQGSGDHYVQILQAGGGGPRSAYTNFYEGNSIYTNDSYSIEFDMALCYTNTNNNSHDNEVILFGEGATMPASNAIFGSTNYVFKLYGGMNKSTTYTVEENSHSFTLKNEEWYHYAINVNKATGVVNYTITSLQGSTDTGGSGQYTIIDPDVNMNVKGMFVALGRYNSYAYIDKIVIRTLATNSIDTYAFEKPGTLSLTANAPGYKAKTVSYNVNLPYVKDGNDYVPVHINDEKCTRYELIGEIEEDGNSHLWRSGIANNENWASFVLPYDMTATQVKEVFGEGTIVANLIETAGDANTLLFETESGSIQANKPFLIKGVTNASPYLIKGVSGVPQIDPVVSTNYYDFIGNYEYKVEERFYFGDYFLTTSGLKRPKYDGITMEFPGYRAFFRTRTTDNSNQAPTIIFDDATRIQEIANTTLTPDNVYTVTGQRVRTNSSSLEGLPRGIYIVDGKTITVK